MFNGTPPAPLAVMSIRNAENDKTIKAERVKITLPEFKLLILNFIFNNEGRSSTFKTKIAFAINYSENHKMHYITYNLLVLVK